MSTDTLEDEFEFTYGVISADEIPDRVRHVPPGRPSRNPHVDTIKAIAGTGEARYVEMRDPGNEEARTKLVNRHARYLRFAAHEHDRSVRVWHVVEGDRLKVCFEDVKYLKRGPQNADASAESADSESADDGEGSPE